MARAKKRSLTRGAVVRSATGRRAIVMGQSPGGFLPEFFVCKLDRGNRGRSAFVALEASSDIQVVGRVKTMPKACNKAMADYRRWNR